jgi:hypothetical protein
LTNEQKLIDAQIDAQEYLTLLLDVRADMLKGGLLKSFTKCDTTMRFTSISELNLAIRQARANVHVLENEPLIRREACRVM